MISVRKASLKDVPTILQLWKEYMRYHDEIIIKKNTKLKPHLIRKKNAANNFIRYIKKNIRSKNAMAYLAEVNGKPAGYCLISIRKNTPIYKLEKIGYINELFVRKEFRGRRISSKFRDEAIKWFKKRGMKYILLEVMSDNKFAHSIYGKWGFFDYHIEMRMKI